MSDPAVPFFSVALFTKNRKQLAALALESVLQQSFTDFEVIVCDNDDTDETAKVMRQYIDPRIRYHRTNGTLPMPDNWDLALSLCRGRYVTSLTDRCVLKSYALERLHGAIGRYGEDVYVWGFDRVDESISINEQVRLTDVPEGKVVPSNSLMHLFLHQCGPRYAEHMPKGLNTCYANTLLQEIRQSTGGRLCLPVAPDFNLAFLTLTHRPRVVLMSDGLFMWHSNSLSNGMSIMYGGDTGARFLRDLGLTEEDLSNLVPIKAIITHNYLCNDLLRLKQRMPERFRHVALDLFYYFLACRHEIERLYRPDEPAYIQKMAALDAALAQQPPSLGRRVRRCAEQGYPVFNQPPLRERVVQEVKYPVKRMLQALHVWEPLRSVKNAARRQSQAGSATNGVRQEQFASILDALKAIEAHERGVDTTI